MKIVAFGALSLVLLGCEAPAPVEVAPAPASAGGRVFVLQPVEARGAVLSAGPAAAFELADLFVDERLCYYGRTDGVMAPLADATGGQICEQPIANPVFVAPVSG